VSSRRVGLRVGAGGCGRAPAYRSTRAAVTSSGRPPTGAPQVALGANNKHILVIQLFTKQLFTNGFRFSKHIKNKSFFVLLSYLMFKSIIVMTFKTLL
jgi:hypothetical protein